MGTAWSEGTARFMVWLGQSAGARAGGDTVGGEVAARARAKSSQWDCTGLNKKRKKKSVRKQKGRENARTKHQR